MSELNKTFLSSLAAVKEGQYAKGSELYDDFTEVGKGNFGCVYSVKATYLKTSEIVAIKKIKIEDKNLAENSDEIERELMILRNLKHPNCVELKDVFMENSTVWIVMEYCLGSCYDLIIASSSSGLNEEHTSYIIFYTLKALEYIHGKNLIHRDVKADFGSASIKSPASTFVGSPYWMAPEVMSTMDESNYDSKADLWSLGITCIELATKKPPLFHLNSICAIYHISQGPPPQLEGDNWYQYFLSRSENILNFTKAILKMNPEERSSINELFQMPFLKKDQPNSIMISLLIKCANNARMSDSLAYRKFLSVLEEPMESIRYSPSMNPDDNSPVYTLGENVNSLKIDENARRSDEIFLETKIYTIKTATALNYELMEHQKHDKARLKEYQEIRKTHNKQLLLLEQKLTNELNEHLKINQKLIETTRQAGEKILRQAHDRHENELKNLSKHQKSVNKQWAKDNGFDVDKKGFLTTLRSLKGKTTRHRRNLSSIYINRNDSNTEMSASDTERPETFINQLERLSQEFEQDVVECHKAYELEKYSIMIQNYKVMSSVELDNISALARIEMNRIDQIYRMKTLHLKKLHDFEIESHNQYAEENLMLLQKRHFNDQRNKPKELKAIEAKILKQYKDSIKTVQQQYKALIKIRLEKAPKEAHSLIKEKVRAEKMQHIITKENEMRERLAVILSEEKFKLNDIQSRERSELEKDLNLQMTTLNNFQKSQMNKLSKDKAKNIEQAAEKYEKLFSETRTRQELEANSIKESMTYALENLNKIPKTENSVIQSSDNISSSNQSLNLDLNPND